MSTGNPLHRDPERPVLDADGRLANPLTEARPVSLDPRVAMHAVDLLPGTTYVAPGFEYHTDHSARPARVRGVLRLVPPHERIRHHRAQRVVGRSGLGDAAGAFHGGHIVAVSLGGFPSGPNLIPQPANVNTSAFARLERSWRAALGEGCSVEVDIALVASDATTPPFLIVTHWEDGREEELVLLNEPRAQ